MVTELKPVIEVHRADSDIMLYRIPVQVFPNGFTAYVCVVLGAGEPTLIDTGSGFGRSNDDLLGGLKALRDDFGVKLAVTDIRRIIITHGHVDHFGGVSFMREMTEGARIGIHALDRRVLTNYEERVIVATKNLTIYLERAGISPDRLKSLLEMYGFSKKHVHSVSVDFTFEDGDIIDGMTFYHVPGHCPGQVAIRIGDILLSADHILARTSPHLAAESITHYTGVGHYLESLRKMYDAFDVRLTLGGHEEGIENLEERVRYLHMRIEQKMERLLDILRASSEPLSINAMSRQLYQDKHGFDVLLALQECGAYVEYLYERGYLRIANLDEVESQHDPVLLYNAL